MTILSRDEIIDRIILKEGGYSNDPVDPGGETMYGITLAVAQKHKADLVRLYKWDGKMINLTKDMARYIYRIDYWNKMKLDQIHAISYMLAYQLFDMGVNMGISRAGKWLQEILNVSNNNGALYADLVVDGIIGSGTMIAMNTLISKRGHPTAVKLILRCLLARQINHYIETCLKSPPMEKYFLGWLNRVGESIDVYISELPK